MSHQKKRIKIISDNSQQLKYLNIYPTYLILYNVSIDQKNFIFCHTEIFFYVTPKKILYFDVYNGNYF